MLPITEGTCTVRSRSQVRVKDDHLARVLRGEDFLLFDGAMGSMLQERGLEAGELPELLCLTHPEEITQIHAEYAAAGSEVATTNTFGANARKLAGKATVEEVFTAAVGCAKASGVRYVAADIGPTGALLEPMGTMPFGEAYGLFAEQVRAADAAGADLFIIETMADLLEMKAAVLAAKENSSLPVFATMTFGEDGRTFLGTSPAIAAAALDALGVSALGINCSLGPAALAPLVRQMLNVASCPVMVQANAGLPSIVDGKTVYSITPEAYAAAVRPMIEAGASVIGGCCGTSPAYIRQLACALQEAGRPTARQVKAVARITSAQQAVELTGRHVAVIGERINPTGKKRLKQALREGDMDYVVNMALDQAEQGADVLDVNAGLPEIDEAATLVTIVKQVQNVCGLPLQIDSSEPAAVEAAARIYSGKPLVNSVNGKRESLDAILPVCAHYGCAVVGLTLDEGGIPPTAEGRVAIARHIVEAAEGYGIPRQDIYIDCLTMAASTNQTGVVEILEAVHRVKTELGVRTVLGVSNISFGLPAREVLNMSFLIGAFSAGLDMPILNPANERYREAVDSWRLLCAQDEGGTAFIERYAGYVPLAKRAAIPAGTTAATGTAALSQPAAAAQAGATAATSPAATADADPKAALRDAVISGRKGPAADLTRTVMSAEGEMSAIDECLIPALDEVGDRFEAGTFFLPQLMAAAEAAKAGFDVIRSAMAERGEAEALKGPIAVATVKGDIHDIGKNIVKMLLENYGYKVYDLGRDVPPENVVACVRNHGVKLVGLSALMTTTVHNMADTIALLRQEAPEVKVMVGGAVLNEEYAQMVGADYFAKDAAESARIAAELFG